MREIAVFISEHGAKREAKSKLRSLGYPEIILDDFTKVTKSVERGELKGYVGWYKLSDTHFPIMEA